jgi:hypothetical protein
MKTLPQVECKNLSNRPWRNETVCRGCGKAKGAGDLVCWGCFKYREDCFKYFCGVVVGTDADGQDVWESEEDHLNRWLSSIGRPEWRIER